MSCTSVYYPRCTPGLMYFCLYTLLLFCPFGLLSCTAYVLSTIVQQSICTLVYLCPCPMASPPKPKRSSQDNPAAHSTFKVCPTSLAPGDTERRAIAAKPLEPARARTSSSPAKSGYPRRRRRSFTLSNHDRPAHRSFATGSGRDCQRQRSRPHLRESRRAFSSLSTPHHFDAASLPFGELPCRQVD